MINQNLLLTGDDGYNLTKSLRFRQSASAWLNRTFGTPTLSTKWTWSGWFKLGSLTGTNKIIFDGGSPDTRFVLQDISNGPEQLIVGNDTTTFLATSAVYRDYSAWYHAVLAFDSSQGTASNRLRLYINGSEVTAFATDNRSSISGAIGINTATAHGIGKQPAGGVAYFDGYLAEINFVDGQQLTPSSFGETSTSTGVWIPKKYTGTYGTNGFYLPFTDTTSTSTLGTDFSGNSNTWTVNNISLTSGATYDSMNDVPTLTSATTANYCVLNPLKSNSSTSTYQNGNLQVTFPNAGAGGIATGTMAVSSGKFYWEVTVGGTDGSTQPKLGIISPTVQTETSSSIDVGDLGYAYVRNGNKSILGTVTAYGSSFTTNDVIGFALDMDAGTLVCYKNNVSQGTLVSGLTGQFTAGLTAYNGYSETINFGQRPFAYTPPTGFVALNTFNLTTPTIGATASTLASKNMNIALYTGTGSSQSITGLGFQPDWTWIKGRSGATNHGLYDAVRGVQKQLESNTTTAETTETTGLTAFGSDGFTVGALAQLNTSSATYVAWNWKANGAGSTNTAGSITSTVSANTSAGFSIVTYSANGSTGTVGHGLGVAPSMIIVKKRNAAERWCVFHTSTSNAYIYLNETFAAETANAQNRFGNNSSVVQPTSTLFTIGSSNDVNGTSGTYVAYCFAQIAGYSAFGSYTGNGSSDGPFVFTGFRPRYVMIKRTNTTGDWIVYDSARSTYNGVASEIYPNLSNAEDNSSVDLDFVSNGIKLRNSGFGVNGSGDTYIYACFAENPFKYANAR